MPWRDSGQSPNLVFLGDGRLDDENERDERRWGKSCRETGTWENFVCNSIYDPRYSGSESRSSV